MSALNPSSPRSSSGQLGTLPSFPSNSSANQIENSNSFEFSEKFYTGYSNQKSLFSHVSDYFSKNKECTLLIQQKDTKKIEKFIENGGSVKALSQAMERDLKKEFDGLFILVLNSDVAFYPNKGKEYKNEIESKKEKIKSKKDDYTDKLKCALEIQDKILSEKSSSRPLMTRLSQAISKLFGTHVDHYSRELLLLLSGTEEASKNFLDQGGSIEAIEKHANRLKNSFISPWVLSRSSGLYRT